MGRKFGRASRAPVGPSLCLCAAGPPESQAEGRPPERDCNSVVMRAATRAHQARPVWPKMLPKDCPKHKKVALAWSLFWAVCSFCTTWPDGLRAKQRHSNSDLNSHSHMHRGRLNEGELLVLVWRPHAARRGRKARTRRAQFIPINTYINCAARTARRPRRANKRTAETVSNGKSKWRPPKWLACWRVGGNIVGAGIKLASIMIIMQPCCSPLNVITFQPTDAGQLAHFWAAACAHQLARVKGICFPIHNDTLGLQLASSPNSPLGAPHSSGLPFVAPLRLRPRAYWLVIVTCSPHGASSRHMAHARLLPLAFCLLLPTLCCFLLPLTALSTASLHFALFVAALCLLQRPTSATFAPKCSLEGPLVPPRS